VPWKNGGAASRPRAFLSRNRGAHRVVAGDARAVKSIALVAPTDVPVLITGESGTGKELVARAIHRHSGRRAGPVPADLPGRAHPGLVERELFGHIKGLVHGAVQDRAGLLELASGGPCCWMRSATSPESSSQAAEAIEHREVTPVGDAPPFDSPTFRVVAATKPPSR